MSALPPVTVRRSSITARLATSVRAPRPLLHAPAGVAPTQELRTGRLVLRPLAEHDRAAYIDLLSRSRAHLARHVPLHRAGETSEELFERHLAYSIASVATGLAWRRVVCRADGLLIGAVNINDITPAPDRAGEINFWLAPDHAGLGLGREAVEASVTHALSRAPRGLGLARLRAYVAPDNLVSRRLLERAGFAQDAASLPVQLNLAGAWVTHHAYERRAPAPRIALARIIAA